MLYPHNPWPLHLALDSLVGPAGRGRNNTVLLLAKLFTVVISNEQNTCVHFFHTIKKKTEREVSTAQKQRNY